MSRPVIVLAPRQWVTKHPVDLTQSHLEAKFALDGIVNYELPKTLTPDIRLCRTAWPQEICACLAYTLEWHTKDKRSQYERTA